MCDTRWELQTKSPWGSLTHHPKPASRIANRASHLSLRSRYLPPNTNSGNKCLTGI